MNDTILKNLKKHIEESNMPISVIAKNSNISRQYIYKILNNKGKSITTDTLQRIYKVLNIDMPNIYPKQTLNKQDRELLEISKQLNEIEKSKVIGYAKARLEEQTEQKERKKFNNFN